jgi:hypothetical protein
VAKKVPRAISIEDMGIEVYLNATREAHCGFGFDEVSRMFEAGMMITQIAKALNVAPPTIRKYKRIWDKTYGNR